MKKNRLIPFQFLPAAWGLSGQAYDVAEANYYYEGEQLERELIKINHKDEKSLSIANLELDYKLKRVTRYEYDRRLATINGTVDDLSLLDIEYKHNRISEYDYRKTRISSTLDGDERKRKLLDLDHREGLIEDYEYRKACIEIDSTGIAKDIALLELDAEFDKISQVQRDKGIATLKEEPWVHMIDNGFDVNQGVNGFYFELDWNEHWIAYLRMNGYGGFNEDEIVQSWFADLCKAYISEHADEEDFLVPRERMINRFARGGGSSDLK